MKTPVVAILGRPNVGKSTLFNAMVGRKQAIISDVAGTTRDRVVGTVHGDHLPFDLVDTAGLTNAAGEALEDQMQIQAEVARANADLILFVVDARAPLTQDDFAVAEMLRKQDTAVLFAANKVDDGDQTRTYDLMELGFGLPMAVSGKNFVHVWDMMDKIEKMLLEQGFVAPPVKPELEEDELEDAPTGPMKIAFVGRPNVGKSTLMNRLLGQERSIVSDVSGTTRDTIEGNYTAEDGTDYTLLDTAGVRKPGKLGRRIEFWSVVRTHQAIEKSDVCVLLLDAMDGITHQDKALIGKILEAGKGLIIGVNKFDLAREQSRMKEEADERDMDEVKMWGENLDEIRKNYWWYLSQNIGFCPWAPVEFFSAKTGKGVQTILNTARHIQAERYKRVGTSDLNRLLPDIQYGHVAPQAGNKTGKIKYVTQVQTCPPKFLFFVNNVAAFHWSYRRYCENQLRKAYGFHGTPIIVDFRDAMRERDQKRQ